MKTLLTITALTPVILSSLLYAEVSTSLESSVKEYDVLFDKIAEKRIGVDSESINRMPNPFISAQATTAIDGDSNETRAELVYVLEATLDDKAKINGEWYKKNELVGSYKLVNVDHNTVTLKNENEKKELAIRTKDDRNIKIFYK